MFYDFLQFPEFLKRKVLSPFFSRTVKRIRTSAAINYKKTVKSG